MGWYEEQKIANKIDEQNALIKEQNDLIIKQSEMKTRSVVTGSSDSPFRYISGKTWLKIVLVLLAISLLVKGAFYLIVVLKHYGIIP